MKNLMLAASAVFMFSTTAHAREWYEYSQITHECAPAAEVTPSVPTPDLANRYYRARGVLTDVTIRRRLDGTLLFVGIRLPSGGMAYFTTAMDCRAMMAQIGEPYGNSDLR
jgi:hypothetical protein